MRRIARVSRRLYTAAFVVTAALLSLVPVYSAPKPLMYPAQFSSVRGVVAVTNTDIKASFSNYGRSASFSAPGYLWAAHPNHQMAYVSGTSYASLLAAAEAALVIDAYHARPAEIR